MRIVIEVAGGVVQAVFSDAEAEVQILDWDDMEDEGQTEKEIDAKCESLTKGLVQNL